MSASLVGSEMCIRDRTTTGARAQTACTRTVRVNAPRRGWRRRKHRAPVSYTHLTLPTICSV
eukprot:625414-Alexandrium_andersonii.AAC.1